MSENDQRAATVRVPPHHDGDQCGATDDGYICTAAPGHGGDVHAAYVYGDDPPVHTWPAEPSLAGLARQLTESYDQDPAAALARPDWAALAVAVLREVGRG